MYTMSLDPACSPDSESHDLTTLLRQWSDGEGAAAAAVVPLIYNELHWLAGHYLRRERSEHTLQPTALVHEAWVRLVENNAPDFRDRKHFYAIAARLMRQILVDHARTKLAGKRGGGAKPVELNEAIAYSDDNAQQYLDLNDALERLAATDARKAQVIELRFFSGMTIEEIAAHLGISVSTVMREQRFAEAWLSKQLRGVAKSH
jgi:RNA polymerase sigma factor (TIGR02999 family)